MKSYYIKPEIKVKAIKVDQDLLAASGFSANGLDGTSYGGSASDNHVTSSDAKQSLWDNFDN